MSELPLHGLCSRRRGPLGVALFVSALSLGGCIIDADLGDAATGASTGMGGTTGPGLGASESTVTDMGPPGSGSGNVSATGGSTSDPNTTSDGSTSTGEDPSAEGSTGEPIFECPAAPGEGQCSPSDQDCPPGFRCIPWATDGGLQPDSSTCVPLSDNPVARYEPCEIDTENCSDNCGAGDYCYPDTGSGGNLCLAICDEGGDDATCDAGESCATCAKCFFGTCFDGCDPLEPQCPEGASTCEWGSQLQGFGCLPIPEGTAGVAMHSTAAKWGRHAWMPRCSIAAARWGAAPSCAISRTETRAAAIPPTSASPCSSPIRPLPDRSTWASAAPPSSTPA